MNHTFSMVVTHAKSKADYIAIKQENFICNKITLKCKYFFFSMKKKRKLVKEDSEANVIKTTGNR